jgi:amino acid adenylation domain-containing protein/non-ribosomal peptide synthase protein (TIGR01720 family)
VSDIISEHLEHLSAQEKRELLAQLLREKAAKAISSYPLSYGQQALWFLYQTAPESPAYNVAFTARIRSAIDVPALRRTFQTLVGRHASLRTTFKAVDGKPVQEIQGYQEVCFEQIDASNWTWEELKKQVVEVYRHPFDLEQGPVLRVSLFTRSAQDHVLLLVVHHIVFDGWSLWVLLDELRMLYPTEKLGVKASLPPLKLSYADYVQKQSELVSSSVREELWNYWRQELSGELPALNLPTDHPRPPVQTYNGDSCPFKLTKELTQQLKELAQTEGVTLYMTLLAVFQILLHRYTGQETILVGSPTSGRSQTEFAEIVGYFVNMVVLRADLSGNPTFKTFLSRVRHTVLNAIAHQDYPFPLLVEQLHLNRDPSRSPLFQVVFALQKPQQFKNIVDLLTTGETGVRVDWGGLELEPFDMSQQEGQFDLILEMVETKEALLGEFRYKTDLFEATTITRMIGHFQNLVEGIVGCPDQPIADIPLLTEVERHQLLVEWNNTKVEYPQDKCAHQLFEAQIVLNPGSEAIVSGEGRMTYQELNRRANQLAHYLRTRGVGPDVLVGICTKRSLDMIVAILGTLKAGGAYLPLDPVYPEERLVFMLEDARVPVLLTQEVLKLEIRNWKLETCQMICLDSEWGTIAQESGENPVSGVTTEHLAYAIYTSGSTGKPKGVLISHKGLLNLIFWHLRTFDVTSSDRATQLAGMAFDAAVWEVWPYLTVGASLYLIEPDTLNSPAQLRNWLLSKEISICFVPTPLAEELLSLEWPPNPPLRIMLTGGDKLHKYPSPSIPFKFVNNYGPTENSVVSTSGLIGPNGQETLSSPSIGRPIANTQAYIFDQHLQPVPIGVPGELHVSGDGLARGYLNRPDLTEEKFILNPCSNEPGACPEPSRRARLYKTGDLARYLPNGEIEFLGRIDHQVKIRGFRIELGEIESVLTQHPHIREAVVIAREDTPGNKRLVAYVVQAKGEGQKANTTELREYLKKTLPEYMIPSAFVMLESIPLTPNGKVDRRALPVPDRSGLEEGYVMPRTPAEKLLAGIWAEVLGLNQVGIHDNFFELGGDSILSIQIIARARKAGLQLNPSHLFQYQTVAELAPVAEKSLPIQAEQGLVTGSVPLTPIQQWFFEQNFSEPHHWNQAILLEVRQTLEPSFLAKAVQRIIEHHDALRLRFGQEGSQWQQECKGLDEIVPFSYVDLSHIPERDQGKVIELEASKLQASLNLSEGPLIRVALFDFGAGKAGRLFLVIHHLAVDGVSWRILLEDLQTAYQQLSQGNAIQFPPKTTSFKEWSSRLTAYSQSETVFAELDYWLKMLSRTQITPLPVDYHRNTGISPAIGDQNGAVPRNTVASSAQVLVSLSVDQTQALLQEVPQAYNTQINDVLLTALVQTFARCIGRQSLLIDLEGHGREQLFENIDVSRTVGWFTTLFPVLLELKEIDRPGETLKSIKEQLRRIPNRGIGYGLLRYLSRDSAIRQELQAWPQAEVSFNYLGQLDQVLSRSPLFTLSRESIGPLRSPQGQRSHLLEINGFVVEGRLQLEWTYSRNFHKQSTIEHLAQEFINALQALIAHCQSPDAGGYTPSDFPNIELSQEKLDQILAEINLDNMEDELHE